MNNLKRTLKLAASVILTCLIVPGAHADTNLSTLVSFDGSNGGQPWAALTLGKDGNFYGVTDQYGDHNGGTIFRMTPEGQLTTLHVFTGVSDGAHPKATLLQGNDGNFYGTTTDGGNAQGLYYYGDGVVFKISPDGDFQTLAAFSHINGSKPWAGPLVEGPDGFFYGMTAQGGSTIASYPPGFGTAFRVSTNGLLTRLYSFNYDSGDIPYGGLVVGADGNYYGMTSSGGPRSGGTIFNINPAGSLSRLVSFSSYQDTNGSGPFSALLLGKDGNFYGTTGFGGASIGDPKSVNGAGFGTIFKMTPSGTLTTLFSFAGTNGAYPYATMIEDGYGNFYGITISGGAYTNQLFPNGTGYAGYGTIFRFAPDGTLTTLVSFDGTNGAQPFSSLTRGANGKLYGTTIRGGAYDLGTIYVLNIPTDPSSPPTITCSGATTVECGTPAGVDVFVSDTDGEALTVVWKVNGQAVQTNTVPASQSLTGTNLSFSAELPLGTNTVVVTATDIAANTASCSTTITVVDTYPPTIQHATASPNVLWPANHELIAVNIGALVDDTCGSATWKITGVRSNEPVIELGDGNTTPDWIITGDHTLLLRAERSAKGMGRIYLITIQATDQSGNPSTASTLTVTVPKNQSSLVPHPIR